MNRVRLLLPHFRENGWCSEVLAVAPEQVAARVDPWLLGGIAAELPIHRVEAIGLGWSRLPGLGTLGLRAYPALRRAGDLLLGEGDFDLVYFSTTVFELLGLGPRWLKRFNIPFVVDYQDPWVNDYYREHPGVVPPGGRLKYAVVDRLSRVMEPRVLAKCAGITSVSAGYPEQLRRRYAHAASLRALVQPFPAPSSDFARIDDSSVRQAQFDAHDGLIHWVYVGVIVPSMLTAIRGLFSALVRNEDHTLRARLRLHFVGTSYAPDGRAPAQVRTLAREYCIEEMVRECTHRIPYSESLACLRDASAILAFTSDDVAYVPSKSLQCLLARKPMLVICRESSRAEAFFGSVGGAVVVSVGNEELEEGAADKIRRRWLDDRQYERLLPVEDTVWNEYSEQQSARSLCNFFDECLT